MSEGTSCLSSRPSQRNGVVRLLLFISGCRPHERSTEREGRVLRRRVEWMGWNRKVEVLHPWVMVQMYSVARG